MKRKERSRNLQTAEHLCTLNEGGGGGEKGGRTMASQRCDRTLKGSRVVYMHVCVCVEMDKSVRDCVSMCMKRGQGRRLLLIAGFPQLAEYTGLV